MENVNQPPEVVAELTKEQLDKAIAEGQVETSQSPIPPQATAPQQQQPNHILLLMGAKFEADHALGAMIDIGSYKLLNQRVIEYEVTMKQMAVSSALGNKDGFEQMVNQLQGAIYQNQLFLVNMMRKIVEAKAAVLAAEKKEQPAAANDANIPSSPSVPAAPTGDVNNAPS